MALAILVIVAAEEKYFADKYPLLADSFECRKSFSFIMVVPWLLIDPIFTLFNI